MIDKNAKEKIEFSGTIRSVQPRSTVWRYRLDNRTHSLTGYNLFLSGMAEGIVKDYTVVRGKMILPPHGKEFFHAAVSRFLHPSVRTFLHAR